MIALNANWINQYVEPTNSHINQTVQRPKYIFCSCGWHPFGYFVDYLYLHRELVSLISKNQNLKTENINIENRMIVSRLEANIFV